MANLTTLKFGPFTRSVTAVESHIAPPETMATGSYNMLVDPVAGGAFKRSGFSVVGDTLNSGTKRAVAGILESAPEYVPCRLREFYSDALADGALGGSPTHSVLYRKEASSASWPTVDDGVFGTEYVRRPSANYSLLSEFGSTAYPTGGGSHGAEIKYKVVPWWYESGEGGYSRGAFEFARRFAVSGSWNSVDAGRWRFYGGLRSTPMKWDGGCNDSSSSVPNSVRFRPTGPFRPLWVPTVAEQGSSSPTTYTTPSATYPWIGGDTFYLSVMFKYEDGSFSLPTYPKLVTVGAVGTKYGYTGLLYQNIPLGGPDVVERYLLRSKHVLRSATTDDVTVDISDMRILGVLKNNAQTSYLDTLGDDDGLLQNTDIVRWDLICPPRSRYLGTGDQRVIAGYTLPNQAAFELTCVAMGVTSTTYSENVAESNSGVSGNTAAVYRVTESGIDLQLVNGGSVVAGTLVQILWATSGNETLQGVVDRINASDTVYNTGANTVRWRAQIAPGADPTAASTGLCPTVWSVANCTATGTALATSNSFANIPIGYKCYAAAGMTAGTYLIAKTGATGLTLSQSSTTSGATVTFYADCGDEAAVTTAGSKGWIRVFGSAITGMVYFKRSALPGYAAPKKAKIYYTISSPGAVSAGATLAPNAWSSNNVHEGPGNSGQLMGIVDVDGAAILAYRKKIALFINERGSNTGEDFDYRIKPVNNSMGCCSPWSVEAAAGTAVYLTEVGLKAADKSRREVLLTADVYQPVRGLGDLAYEVPLCVAAARVDSPDCWMSVATWGNRLVASFRSDASSYGFMVYDYSRGADQTGLDAIANPEERRPYGWSSPCFMDGEHDSLGPRAMGAVASSDGLRFYGAINDNSGTADGRVDQMFTGSTDNGVTITGAAVTRRYLAEANTRLSGRNVTITHRVGYTGPVVQFSRLESGTVGATYATASSGSSEVKNELLQLSQADRSPGNAVACVFYDDATSTGGLVYTMDLSVEVLERTGG